MKLATFRDGETSKIGALSEEGMVCLTDAGSAPHFRSMQALIEGGDEALEEARHLVETATSFLDAGEVELLAPLPVPAQIRDCLCFREHLENCAAAAPKLTAERQDGSQSAGQRLGGMGNPMLETFLKQPIYYKANRFAVTGTGTDIVWPAYSKIMDFELELACVIGKQGTNISKDKAREHIFGFTIFNDLSARDAQMTEQVGLLGPAKGKDFDKANPMGPYLVTLDEIGDPYDLRMLSRVNGETWTDGSSSTMYWKFEDLIAFISRDETLHPGEILGSGTVGWGSGLEHLKFLNDGDVVELEIEKIGVLRNRILRS